MFLPYKHNDRISKLQKLHARLIGEKFKGLKTDFKVTFEISKKHDFVDTAKNYIDQNRKTPFAHSKICIFQTDASGALKASRS